MKTNSKAVWLAVWVLAALPAPAAVIVNQTFNPSDGTIVAGNLAGQVFTGDFTAGIAGAPVLDITVGLNVTGGYNGDFYVYLVAPNGTLGLLLNQPGVAINGFGASGSAMNITLDDLSPNGSIQNVTSSSALSGSYQAASQLGTFNSSTINGNWTLYFVDEGSGGGNANLNSWSLGIEEVPEPVNPALVLFAALALSGVVWIKVRRSRTGRPKSRSAFSHPAVSILPVGWIEINQTKQPDKK